jgi:hypothetical protein
LLLAVVLGTAASAKSQSRLLDTTGNKLAAKTTIPVKQAKKIQAVMNYRRDDIVGLMKNQALAPDKKRQLLAKLLTDRQRHIDSLTTPAERQALKTYFAVSDKVQQERIQQALAGNKPGNH